jgi:hypothetical protein
MRATANVLLTAGEATIFNSGLLFFSRKMSAGFSEKSLRHYIVVLIAGYFGVLSGLLSARNFFIAVWRDFF